MSNSVLVSLTESRLKSHFNNGTLPSPGVRSLFVVFVLEKMPPITVVWPSPTRTVVFARCVLIETRPSGVVSPREPLSTEIFMITVPAAVICGVTRRLSAAST